MNESCTTATLNEETQKGKITFTELTISDHKMTKKLQKLRCKRHSCNFERVLFQEVKRCVLYTYSGRMVEVMYFLKGVQHETSQKLI